MLTIKQLEAMNQLEFEEIDISKLVDIREVQIDTALPVAQRMESYLEQIKNPYCFRHGDAAIHVRFEPEGTDLRQKLKNLFINSKTQ